MKLLETEWALHQVGGCAGIAGLRKMLGGSARVDDYLRCRNTRALTNYVNVYIIKRDGFFAS